ncbi:MAG TPA: hypothetical protein EYG85_06975 [Crocinitomix sp.]|nr:hypothetical protein [Crocinitomix sp.]
MRRIIIGIGLVIVFINTSCEKCKKCHYTYSETKIIQTPNGEEVQTTDGNVGYLVNDSGELFQQECIKGDEQFTIEEAYNQEKETTTLDNFEVICEDI